MSDLIPQEKLDILPSYRDKWYEISKTTGRANLELVEKLMPEIYKAVDQAPPENYFVCDSPVSAVVLYKLLDYAKDDFYPAASNFDYYAAREDNASEVKPLFSQGWSKHTEEIKRQILPSLKGLLPDEKWEELKDHEITITSNDVSYIASDIVYGYQDSTWNAFFDFGITEVPDIEEFKTRAPLVELHQNVGWYTTFEDTVIVQNRALRQLTDNRRMLHCDCGPAVLFRDGFSMYCWHGQVIPARWIEEAPTVDDALHWENIEQRRCAAEILGWHHVLEKLNALVIDEDPNELVGTLYECEIPDIGTERFLKCCDYSGPGGEKRIFAIPVPMEMQTAKEANANSYGLTVEEFDLFEGRT